MRRWHVEAVFYLLLAFFVLQVLLKLTGHSPTTETLLTTGLGLVVSYLLMASLQLGQFTGKTLEFMSNAKESFRNIRTDMTDLRSDLGNVKQELALIKREVRRISQKLDA